MRHIMLSLAIISMFVFNLVGCETANDEGNNINGAGTAVTITLDTALIIHNQEASDEGEETGRADDTTSDVLTVDYASNDDSITIDGDLYYTTTVTSDNNIERWYFLYSSDDSSTEDVEYINAVFKEYGSVDSSLSTGSLRFDYTEEYDMIFGTESYTNIITIVANGTLILTSDESSYELKFNDFTMNISGHIDTGDYTCTTSGEVTLDDEVVTIED